MDKLTKRDLIRIGAVMVVLAAVLLASMFLNALISNANMGEVVRESGLTYLCVCALFVFLVFVYFVCMSYIGRDIVKSLKKMVMLASVVFISFELNLVIGATVNLYLRPYALVALLLTVLFNLNTGIFTSFVVILLTLFNDMITGEFGVSQANLAAILLGVVSCVFSSVACDGKSERFRAVLAGITIAVPSIVVVGLSEFMFGSAPRVVLQSCIYACTSPIFSVMLFMIFLPLFEKLFNVVTTYRLYELTDPSAPLMKMLKEVAPGTFNHAIVVANLAEACAYKIGANPQLARAAAYYHDIGKTVHPEYFVENQSRGVNPHDDLTPEMSTSIIKRHGIAGYEICLDHNIPREIADVCLQHHGTLPIYYFYMKAQKFTDGTLDIDQFRYDGPKPQSKVAAIIMIADACEAAIRASESKDIDKIEEIVRKIIEQRIDEDQFTECDLTFKEVYDIKDAIVANYTGIYHERLKYPKLKLSKKRK